MATSTSPTPAVLFKRGPQRGNAKKRTRVRDNDSSGDEETSVLNAASVAQKLKDKKTSALSASTGTKKRKEDTLDTSRASKLDVAFEASGTAASILDNMATRTLDVDGDDSEEKKFKEVLSGDAAESADNLYKGMANYKEYVNKRTDSVTQSNASRIRAGPLKASANVRISCRFDYQADICKDYKETGYCGYGDSCIFMHDRGDYKTGWQLDQEWEEKQKQENDPNRFLINEDEEREEEIDEDEDLPFACVICRREFREPIVTKCKHYFCEGCALKHYAKSPKCFICGIATQGLFAPAKDLQEKLKLKKQRMEEREKEIREENAEALGAEEEEEP
ncbi:hypothetical protein DFS34DRAFT_610168 [Phlyctochytrium arcticum]|nr:hypothetical protein DFS34DRAFT_610168 [Phlyctochytrium arcticum]